MDAHPYTYTPRFYQFHAADALATRRELIDGLSASQASISPKYFYDELGSHLFTAITQLPEYYPTRTEAHILARYGPQISERAGAVASLIDLGAGDCRKAAALMTHVQVEQYVPIDISVQYLHENVLRVQNERPNLEVLALGLDFCEPFVLPEEVPPAGRLFFFPGSSIGNLPPPDALALLTRIHALCPQGGLLIGIDRVKPRQMLEQAYDDALGITAAFNRNLLLHVNRLAGTDFQLAQWTHRAHFDTEHSRVEMHLQAESALTVSWDEDQRHFAQHESILTEYSYKYEPEHFHELLTSAGFRDIAHWSDDDNLFSIFHGRA